MGAVNISGVNLTVSVDPSGAYDLTLLSPAWHFTGNIGQPLKNLAITTGADAVGNYSEIGFDFQSDAPRHAAIRCYGSRAAVLFSTSEAAGAPNTFAFPNWTEYPQNLDHLTFSGIFAPPNFYTYSNESPWIFFDPASHAAFILSPAANFMTASTTWGKNGEMSTGIDASIASLPAGFTHSSLMVFESGIQKAFGSWGDSLTKLQGKTRPGNDADPSLNQVGYWTDNGATYYYQTATGMTYPQTLTAVKANFDQLGIGLGYVQLDSWFYPKGSSAAWTANGSGIFEYSAASPLFTAGLGNFQQSLGVPLVTHARWIDASSPYHQLYKMSGNVVLDAAYWNSVAAYLATSGVATYEQDWLDDKAQPDFNLTDAEMFLGNMATAMAQRGLTMQYCMASPRHFLQSTKYNNLTSIRASSDRLNRDRWSDFLYTSSLAAALGVWPYADNFMSTEPGNLLLATLSAGPIGIGDALGSISGANLLHAVRRDGVIVKPDAPLTPIDSSYSHMAHSVDTPQIATSYTEFGGARTQYVFAYTQGSSQQVSVSAAELGIAQPAYLYDYFSGTGQVVAPADTVQKTITGEALYLVAAPIGVSGIAMLGDLDQYVPMGKKRIAAFHDDGTVQLTVSFATGESVRTLHGYAPYFPAVTATAGAAGHVSYDAATHRFQVAVMPDASGTASVVIKRAHTRVSPVAGPDPTARR